MADDFDFLTGNPGLPDSTPAPKPVQRPVTKAVPTRVRVTSEPEPESPAPGAPEPELPIEEEIPVVAPGDAPEPAVLEHISVEDEDDDEEEELDVMSQAEEPPKKKAAFKLPAWLVVAVVLGLAGAGWVVLSPLLKKIAKKPPVGVPDISTVVAGGDMQPTKNAPVVPAGTPIVAASPVQVPSSTPKVASVPSTPLPVATPILTTPVPAPPVVVVATPAPTAPAANSKITFEGVTIPSTTFTFEPLKDVSGSVTQVGVLHDGEKTVAVASIPQMDFEQLVRTLSGQALDAAKAVSPASTLSGPSRLGNASFPASIFSITQATTSLDGAELREVITYLVVGGPTSNLLFATKTKSSEAGYGLSKFISLASELEYTH